MAVLELARWQFAITTVWRFFFVRSRSACRRYLVLEGFDLGVGAMLRVLGRDEPERRALLNTFGPVWDGNEVWLLVAGGATFAAFPEWYATMFSGFYLALSALLAAVAVVAAAGAMARSRHGAAAPERLARARRRARPLRPARRGVGLRAQRGRHRGAVREPLGVAVPERAALVEPGGRPHACRRLLVAVHAEGHDVRRDDVVELRDGAIR